jgi:DNA polymerase I
VKILAVDADNLIHRGFHAIPPMTGPDGTPNNALRGFCNGILNLIELTSPDIIICAFDAGVPAWRKAARPEYKANRAEKAEELKIQLQAARLILSPALGFHVAWKKEIEADDQLHTICAKASARGDETDIASGDKDLAQCLEIQNVRLWRPAKKGGTQPTARGNDKGWDEWTREDVIKEWGVEPPQIAELLAILGDSADNLSGIEGVGKKTASKWLQQYGNTAAILLAAQENRLAPSRLAARVNQEDLAANLLVTKAHDTGYEIPTEKREAKHTTSCLEELGLYKVARNWETLGYAGKIRHLKQA